MDAWLSLVDSGLPLVTCGLPLLDGRYPFIVVMIEVSVILYPNVPEHSHAASFMQNGTNIELLQVKTTHTVRGQCDTYPGENSWDF